MPEPAHREIEVKLPVRDISALIPRLKALGAVNHGRVFEQNTLCDTPDSDLWRSGRLLRLRVETPARSTWSPAGRRYSVITCKCPSQPSRRTSKYKERLERETAITDPENWPRILESVGFRPSFVYQKFRTSFRLPGLHLDLDETPAGTFLELEGSANAIDRTAKALGYGPRDYFSGTYWDVYAADCRRKGVKPKNMVFDKKKLRKLTVFA